MWACPHCTQALQLHPDGKSWLCSNRHQFDCAKEGYVNLLPSNRKRSREPGDSAAMIAARHRVHRAKIYQPLADSLGQQVGDLSDITAMLDLGCGEGYYCDALSAAQPDAQLYGVDIARAAVRLAAKGHKAARFAVASAYQLPLLDASQDLVIRVFAPSDDVEVRRVLRPRGYYLEVAPAPRHLWELRENLYGTPRAHEPARTHIEGMQLAHGHVVEYELALERDLLGDVISMTPYAYRGHREKRDALLRQAQLSVSMAFSINLFQA